MTTLLREKPFARVVDQAHALLTARDPVDQRAPLARFAYHRNDGQARLHPLQEDGVFGPGLSLTPLAHRQLMHRLRYPLDLLDRLPDALTFACINHLMQYDTGGDNRLATLRLVRLPEGATERAVRAVLGSQYTPLDDVDLLAILEPYLRHAKVVYDAFQENATHLTAIWPDQADPATGLIRGIHVANSEVGTRSITLEAVLYRAACANILPAAYTGGGDDVRREGDTTRARIGGRGYRGQTESGWRFRHTGGNGDRLAGFVRDAMDDLGRCYETAIARWREGLAQRVADPIGAIERVAEAGGLTQAQLHAALEAWGSTQPDFGPTVTGIANTYTLGAHVFEDAETRHEMQQAGALAFRVSYN